MVVKKYKKNKNDIGAMGGGAPNMSIKEPFIYNERVAYGAADDDKVSPGDTVVFQLHDIACIVPFGVAAEQFICWQKNDIYNIVELSKAQNKKQKPSFGSASNTQDNSKDGKQQQAQELDTGLLSEAGPNTAQLLEIPGPSAGHKVSITPTLYNSFRRILRNA